MTTLNEEAIQKLRDLYASRAEALRIRLNEFAQVTPSDYFYELVYCILTPQSSARNAARAVEKLQRVNFHSDSIDPEPILFEKDAYIRFHKTKARLLEELKKDFPEILTALSNGPSATELREWLVRRVNGIGYKEASHFLRNIGIRELAILDRHILKNLKKFGVIRSIPKSLTHKHYLRIERRFQEFAARVGIPLDELDLLFWSLETGEILK